MVAASIIMTVFAAQQVDVQTGRHQSPLSDYVTLTLSTDRQVYYVGERVRLRLAFKNTSDQIVRGHFGVAPGLGPTRIIYRAGAQEFTELRCFPSPAGRVSLGRRTIPPDDEAVQEVDAALATLEPLRLLLDRKGSYEFQAVFEDGPEDPNGRLQSNIVSVDVVEAPGDERAPQAEYTPALAYLAQIVKGSRAYVPADTMAAAASFLQRYRSSRYAAPVREGLSRYLQYRVGTRRASEDERALYEELTRKDDTTPPELHASASPATLWPPNHKLERVLVGITVSDDTDAAPAVRLESVRCDDGCDPAEDVVGAEAGTDDREFELRAERSGGGSRRTYTVTYSATDASGNKTLRGITVVVPHDQKEK